MKKHVYVFLVFLCPLFVSSQNIDVEGRLKADSIDSEQPAETSKRNEAVSATKHMFDLGVGLGCDYSGLGLKVSYLPISNISLFASGGFVFFDFGWNVGACYHLPPINSNKTIRPHIKAMYGYNEIIVLFDAKEYNQLYYGFTPGIGFEFRFNKSKNRGFDFDINYPFTSDKFKDDHKRIEDNPDVDIKKPFPLAFALGYHWQLSHRKK